MTAHNPARFAASPKSLGYRMPAEYAPHKRTWMMWPTRAEVWPDMEATKRDYAKVAHAIAEFEPLCMAVRPEDAAEAAADRIEMELRASGLTEIPSSRIGAAAMDALRSLDQIAYIRFASVYQSFEDLEDLKREVDTLYAERGTTGVTA